MPLTDTKLYINREWSWLAFNDRVLQEAKDPSLPLYERLKFLAIVSSNLDEFFMVRVAGLKQQLLSNVADTAADGLLPGEQLAGICERAHLMVAEQYRLWREEIMPALSANGVSVQPVNSLTPEQKNAMRSYFQVHVFPALTPLAVDSGHPFPHLRNKSLNVAVLLRKSDGKGRRKREVRHSALAVVQVPSVLPRLVPVPSLSGQTYVLLGDLIAVHCGELFAGYTVEHTATFRVTRNTDLTVDEEDSEDLLSTVQEELRRRDRGAAVRLEIDVVAAPELERSLAESLKLGAADIYRVGGPLQLQDFLLLSENDPRADLRAASFTPALPATLRDADSVFHVVEKGDILLHHPYESFDPVVRFLQEAAEDPNVLAIKQTLYRTSGDSPFVRALTRAAENGKQVAVLVEIKARFDEANNIAWARRLEESGVHVVYGLIGLKTHCKVAMVVRREGNRIRRYMHLSTGNYNPTTARVYTDLSYFTAREELADDVTALFNMLTGFAEVPSWKKLAVAPLGLQARIIQLIDREAKRAKAGEPARIIAKLNALVDSEVIRALYAASQAGVDIDLLVRGICCLRPGVPGVSERIRVTSVVDRFLEHTRVFAFGAAERVEVYLSSADWMPRNFLRRIEVMFPIDDPALKTRLLDEVLGTFMKDNVKARRLQSDGVYAPVDHTGAPVRVQTVLLETAKRSERGPQVIRQAAAPEVPPEAIRPAAAG